VNKISGKKSVCSTESTGNVKNKLNRTKQHKVHFHPRTGHKSPERE